MTFQGAIAIKEFLIPIFGEYLIHKGLDKILARRKAQILINKFVNLLLADYEELERSEGEKMFIPDDAFFQDSDVRNELTNFLKTMELDQRMLEQRFEYYYGAETLERFHRNLDDLVKIWPRWMEEELPIEFQAAFNQAKHDRARVEKRIQNNFDQLSEQISQQFAKLSNEIDVKFKSDLQVDERTDEVQMLFKLGWSALETNRAEEALYAFRKVTQLDPNDIEAQFNLSMLIALIGNIDDAIAEYQRTIAMDPCLAIAHYNLGVLLHEKGEISKAIEEYQTAIRLDNNYPKALNNLGRLLRERGDIEEAKRLILKALELNPNFPQAMVNYGLVLEEFNQLNEAAICYFEAIELDPNNILAHFHFGKLLALAGRIEPAIEEFQDVIRLDPNQYSAHIQLGILLGKKREYISAENILKSAIDLQPDLPIAYYNLYIVLRESGRTDEAEKVYQKLNEIDPNFINEEFTLQAFKNPEAHIELYRKAIENDPKDPFAYYRLSILLQITGNNPEAKESIHNAIIYMVQSNIDLAFAWLEPAKMIDPEISKWVKNTPELKLLRDDPRFNKIS